MCGIAGIIHRSAGGANVGAEMTSILQALKHRGPDSSGFAVYGNPRPDQIVMRFKVAERADMEKGPSMLEEVKARREVVDTRIEKLGGEIISQEESTEYAFRYWLHFSGDLDRLAASIEEVERVEILSLGERLELVKDLGDATQVAEQYGLSQFEGTHAIGHTRMATESDVDIRSAHPFWAFPYKDVAVVHNGQLTNYWTGRRELERRGHRFASDCDSELVSVYLADKLDRGIDLESAMKDSVRDFDGVFTYLVATDRMLGMAKDTLAAKPLVLYESDELVVLASEEVAIRSIFPREIDTSDPYEGEVSVWQI
jgi:glutamate synthase domain-containing protein 1